MQELLNVVKPWTAAADQLIYNHLPQFAQLWESGKLDKQQMQTLSMLSVACCSASYGQLILVDCGKLGEAEILGRTVLEGSLKFVYLVSDEGEAATRFSEFTDALFDFASVKDHFAVRSYFDAVASRSEEITLPLGDLLMDEEKIDEFRQRHSKADRNVIEQKWSVPKLIGELASRKRAGSASYAGLVRNYVMSSHVAHADYYGLIAMREREGRGAERQLALDIAHAGRIVSDVISLSTMRLTEALEFAGCGQDVVFPILKQAHDVMKMLEEAHERWFRLEFGDRVKSVSASAEETPADGNGRSAAANPSHGEG